MKLFSFLLLFIVMIEYIQSKKTQRTFIVERDNVIKEKQLSAYTIFDSTGKTRLYQLKTTSTDIDTLILINYPAKNMVANLEGEWVDKVFNVSFTLYDKKLHKWTDGTIRIDATGFREKYSIGWNSQLFNTKTKFWSGTLQLYHTRQKELIAEIRRRTPWFGGKVKFELKTYSSQFPDAIYFFILAINDHRIQIAAADD